jgi:histidine triad (HIT) family protein
MNLRQMNPGHVLVIPRAHIATIDGLDDATAARLLGVAAHVARAIRAAFDPPGLTVWQSNGAVAGQEIDHVHIHLLPRYPDDDFIGFYRQPPPPIAPDQRDALAERLRSHMAT